MDISERNERAAWQDFVDVFCTTVGIDEKEFCQPKYHAVIQAAKDWAHAFAEMATPEHAPYPVWPEEKPEEKD